jgi:ATP synthase protein I
MLKAVLLQATMILLVAALAAAVGGAHAAWSAAFGGLACVIPNASFALRLSMARRRGGVTVHGLFIGEFVKVAATVLLIVAVAHFYRDLNWLAFIVGCIATLKSYFLMFILGRRFA